MIIHAVYMYRCVYTVCGIYSINMTGKFRKDDFNFTECFEERDTMFIQH